jgi:hypothetical protein
VSVRQIASADERRSVEDDAGGHTRLKGVIIYWLNELSSLLAVELHFKGKTEKVKKSKQLFKIILSVTNLSMSLCKHYISFKNGMKFIALFFQLLMLNNSFKKLFLGNVHFL